MFNNIPYPSVAYTIGFSSFFYAGYTCNSSYQKMKEDYKNYGQPPKITIANLFTYARLPLERRVNPIFIRQFIQDKIQKEKQSSIDAQKYLDNQKDLQTLQQEIYQINKELDITKTERNQHLLDAFQSLNKAYQSHQRTEYLGNRREEINEKILLEQKTQEEREKSS